jgi:hypothetical protein
MELEELLHGRVARVTQTAMLYPGQLSKGENEANIKSQHKTQRNFGEWEGRRGCSPQRRQSRRRNLMKNQVETGSQNHSEDTGRKRRQRSPSSFDMS